MAFSSIPFFPG